VVDGDEFGRFPENVERKDVRLNKKLYFFGFIKDLGIGKDLDMML
jgi:hypothetical protein